MGVKRNVFCLICGKRLSRYNAKYCKKHCYQVMKSKAGKHNPNYKDGSASHKVCIDCGKPVSKVSQRCKSCAQKGKRSHRYGKISYHGKGGWYKDIWMRSSYEIKYAKYLDEQNIFWEYEPKTFDLGDETYTPDFYLPSRDLWVEVKGYWRKDAKRKFNKFKEQYPELQIVVVDKSYFQLIGVEV